MEALDHPLEKLLVIISSYPIIKQVILIDPAKLIRFGVPLSPSGAPTGPGISPGARSCLLLFFSNLGDNTIKNFFVVLPERVVVEGVG